MSPQDFECYLCHPAWRQLVTMVHRPVPAHKPFPPSPRPIVTATGASGARASRVPQEVPFGLCAAHFFPGQPTNTLRIQEHSAAQSPPQRRFDRRPGERRRESCLIGAAGIAVRYLSLYRPMAQTWSALQWQIKAHQDSGSSEAV
jgi:hypothetical protein